MMACTTCAAPLTCRAETDTCIPCWLAQLPTDWHATKEAT